MRKAVLLSLGSPMLVGSALAGGGGGASTPSDLIGSVMWVVHIIARSIGLL